MKRNSKKLLTLLLAGALCATAFGGAAAVASAEESTIAGKTYALSGIFTAKDEGKIDGASKVAETDEKATAKFSFKKAESTVTYNRDLALKWFTGKGQAQYMGFTFAFADENYQDLSFVLETAPYQTVEKGIAVNTIKFEKTPDGASVKVFSGDDEGVAASFPVDPTEDIKVQLGESEKAGVFTVNVNDVEVGEFTNIGANYAQKGYEGSVKDEKVETLVMKATPAENAEETSIFFKELNGQAFDNLVNERVEDRAAPVLVVNQELSNYLLGTAFTLEYKAIDVLKETISVASGDRQYYQYNPTTEEIKGKNITTSTYFMDTVYEKADGTTTSVWREEGAEYVSIWFDLGDETYTASVDSETTTSLKKVRYELAWYAEGAVSKTVGEGEKADTRDYIVLNRNEEGPEYIGIVHEGDQNVYTTADGETTENYEESTLKAGVDEFQTKLEEAAEKVYAGSNSEISLPAMDWLLADNNGFQGLLFTISYKTPTSTSASNSSNKKHTALKITTASEGWYEFKIFANDATGNKMKYYLNGELVEVSTSNVWDIEEIPTFKFKVENKGIRTEEGEDNNTLDSKILDESYTMSAINIEGATNEESAYKLFKLKDEIWTANDVSKKISAIKFKDLNLKADALVKAKLEADADLKITDIDFMAIYLEAFEILAGEKVEGVDFTGAFEEIEVYNSEITKDDEEAWEASDNKYNWSATSRRFTAAEEGLYLILADYWDAELSTIDRVPAYQLIEVEEEEDTIPGISEWLENNMLSIVLFGVAGVLLIALIVIWFVKPSDETLEDVDKKAKK